MFKKILAILAAVALTVSNFSGVALAADTNDVKAGDVISVDALSDLQEGTYDLDAVLSCYVSAMGGVEFGSSLLSDADLNVAEDGTATMTLSFTTSSVTIYGVTANTYVSAEGKTQYYNGSSWVNASYTTDTNGYVKTMTFPITETSGVYKIALMVGSNMMSTQFGGEGASYNATLTVNWDKVTVVSVVEKEEVPEEAPEETPEETPEATPEETPEDSTDTVISVSKLSELEAGSYILDADLSCYVSAMGGVEFGSSLLSGAVLTVAEDGTATVTLSLTTSSVTIYGVTANTYVSTEGKIQYFNGSSWVNASYTTDANGYIKTMTFPITEISDAYKLALMIGSDVMSTQFGGEGASYDATLTVNWSKVTVGELTDDGNDNNSSDSDTSDNTQNNETTNTTNKDSETEITTTTSSTKAGTVISVSNLSDLEPGTYGLSASLSCYVSAMGGVEFGSPLLSSAVLNVAEDGTATITLTFKTSSVTIYGVTANTYVSGEGKVQYWNGSSWVNASYTTDANGYVKTMTFPITKISSTYKLALMIGSDVMSTQFGGADSKYNATLTVNWNKVTVGGSGSTTPKTGDAMPMMPIVGVLTSAVILSAVLYSKKRKVE